MTSPHVQESSSLDKLDLARCNVISAVFVAIIEPVGGHGGMHLYNRGLCSGLISAGCRVSLYTCDETQDPEVPGLGFYPSYRGIYGNVNRLRRGLRFIASTFSTLRHVIASGANICHFHAFNDVITESIALLMARIFRVRIVITVHDVDSFAGHNWGKARMTRLIYRLADRTIVHNAVSMRELIAAGVPSQKIAVIPHGHYLDYIGELPTKAAARDKLGIEPFAKVILFFGQIKQTKGLDLLIESLPVVAGEIPNVLLLIAGRPWKTDMAAYESLIEKLKVRRFCRLHIGFIPDQEVAAFYSAADLVALPYRRIYQSGVLLMAMSFFRPVVASDLPGMTEIVTNGANGYVFANGSATDLAEALIRALRDEQENRNYAERALEYITRNHGWGRIGESTATLYREVINL